MKATANFRACPHESQGTSCDILFINVDAPSNEIWEAASSRLDAVRRLNDELAAASGEKASQTSLALVNSILLSDVTAMVDLLGDRLCKHE
ncbi:MULTISPECIES: hypothetical protein [Tenebrionibacter/Tenebrionicola group]|jgi:hypothetical protein|uniref:Uncharacterized protein n=2 Tax=Tenebrionibacter/Tenebrionicola group TaxID=2969848 RepID=A0A8K0V0X1_9ENTR|nr:MULTISPECIES: hypothetical protein [Tenebrionibacter/Tenebrionicola group]MBK4714596.1 hypothetical protein [Tenebrionibacter intestinalis]MBV5095050.1 hypothetical protein [Tenebrionicola larvae]